MNRNSLIHLSRFWINSHRMDWFNLVLMHPSLRNMVIIHDNLQWKTHSIKTPISIWSTHPNTSLTKLGNSEKKKISTGTHQGIKQITQAAASYISLRNQSESPMHFNRPRASSLYTRSAAAAAREWKERPPRFGASFCEIPPIKAASRGHAGKQAS